MGLSPKRAIIIIVIQLIAILGRHATLELQFTVVPIFFLQILEEFY